VHKNIESVQEAIKMKTSLKNHFVRIEEMPNFEENSRIQSVRAENVVNHTVIKEEKSENIMNENVMVKQEMVDSDENLSENGFWISDNIRNDTNGIVENLFLNVKTELNEDSDFNCSDPLAL